MLILKMKKEQNVVGEMSYKISELKKLSVNVEAMANAKYWKIVVDAIAQAIFKNYADVDSIFAYDTKYEDLDHMSEVFNENKAKELVIEQVEAPDYYDWDYEPTDEELNGEKVECEEF